MLNQIRRLRFPLRWFAFASSNLNPNIDKKMTLTGVFLCLLCLESSQKQPDIAELEDAVLKSRSAFVKGHIELESHYWSIQGKKELKTICRETIWFDGVLKRRDRVYDNDPNKLDRSITCWADGKVIDWHKAGVSPITITDETLIAEPSPENILRPHEIGLIPASSGNMIQHRAEEIFKKEKRSNLKTHQEKLNDKECWLVSYTIERPGKPVEVRYWIAPALGNAVMRVEVRFEADERAFVDSIESDHKEVQPGVWFPEKCLYQRRVNDKIATQEILHIKVNKYNADPEPTAFTLQGMNIPPGAPLSIVSKTDKRAGFALTWDGKEIVFSK